MVQAIQIAVWLVNSAYQLNRPDQLTDLSVFLDAFPGSDLKVAPAQRSRELASLRAARSGLRDMILAPRDQMVAHVNEALAGTSLTLRLVRHDGSDWHVHALTDGRTLAQWVTAETALALIDMMEAHEDSRIFVCADDTCRAVALDLSRNRSKRYCSTACSNRNAVATYRARVRESQ